MTETDMWWPGLWHPTLVALPTSPPFTFRFPFFQAYKLPWGHQHAKPSLTSGPLHMLSLPPTVLFTQTPAGLTPHLHWGLYSNALPHMVSPYSASFFLIASSPFKIILHICLLSVSHFTLQAPRGQGLCPFPTKYSQWLEQVLAHNRCSANIS